MHKVWIDYEDKLCEWKIKTEVWINMLEIAFKDKKIQIYKQLLIKYNKDI